MPKYVSGRCGWICPKPDGRAGLKRVIEVNTCPCGGVFNFIIPIFTRTPKRYSDPQRLKSRERPLRTSVVAL